MDLASKRLELNDLNPKGTMSSYFTEDDKIMREWQAEVRSSYDKTCAQHHLLFLRYQRLPEHIRSSNKLSEQVLEDIGEFSSCKSYSDTMWSGMLALLGTKFDGNDVASFSDLGLIENFVGRVQGDVKKLEKAVSKLETCLLRKDSVAGKGKPGKGVVPRGPRALIERC